MIVAEQFYKCAVIMRRTWRKKTAYTHFRDYLDLLHHERNLVHSTDQIPGNN